MHGVPNHRQPCYLFRQTTKKASKLCITGPLWGESTCDWLISSIKWVTTIPAKNMEYFLFQRIFCIFEECSGRFCTWNTFLRIYITFRGVKYHLTAKWSAKVRKQLFVFFFSIRLWLESLLSLCQIAAISICVLYRNMVHNTILYLQLILVRSAGD